MRALILVDIQNRALDRCHRRKGRKHDVHIDILRHHLRAVGNEHREHEIPDVVGERRNHELAIGVQHSCRHLAVRVDREDDRISVRIEGRQLLLKDASRLNGDRRHGTKDRGTVRIANQNLREETDRQKVRVIKLDRNRVRGFASGQSAGGHCRRDVDIRGAGTRRAGAVGHADGRVETGDSANR